MLLDAASGKDDQRVRLELRGDLRLGELDEVTAGDMVGSFRPTATLVRSAMTSASVRPVHACSIERSAA